jgi:hypothetical protein
MVLILHVLNSIAIEARGINRLHPRAKYGQKASRVIRWDHVTALHLLDVPDEVACWDRDTSLRKLRMTAVVAQRRLCGFHHWRLNVSEFTRVRRLSAVQCQDI